jgi:hypothetical protein
VFTQAGVAMKMACGGMTRREWNRYRASHPRLEVSHLHGISEDLNPLNYNVEDHGANVARRPCHSLHAIATNMTRVHCNIHIRPCDLFTARMIKNWPQIVGEMINKAKQGLPAIAAYETGIDFQLRWT